MSHDVIILGAGAAGLYLASRLRGRRAVVLDHARNPAEKVRISGGGRCNFTNLLTGPHAFLSANPHFAKSALASFTAHDFAAEIEAAGIPWTEKAEGQLFCAGSSRDMVRFLVEGARAAGAELRLSTPVAQVAHDGHRFAVGTPAGTLRAPALVVATGGKSIPRMGATTLGYRIADQFGLPLTETRPALVPLTFNEGRFPGLAGVAAPVRATARDGAFEDAALFTHRGLSGPAILQASSFWREGDDLALALAPATDWAAALREARATSPKAHPSRALARHLPQRLADHLAAELALPATLAALSDARLQAAASALACWRLKPTGTEGYRTAEVTLGGVATSALSSRSMEARAVPGLFLIGEVVDVTGWLGGHNFQWAWSSAAACARALNERPR